MTWIPSQKIATFTLVGLIAVSTATVAGIEAPEQVEPSGTIRGLVVDDQGSPISAADVTITTLSSSTTTNLSGRFELPTIPVGIYSLKASCKGYAEAISGPVEVTADATTEITVTLVPRLVALREIEVTASASLLAEQPTAAVALDRTEIRELPHFGDDLYRAIAVLPSTAGGDFSARFTIRGGLYDETLVNLDGQELMEPFHLKDFQGFFSILDPEMIGGVELTPGGFTAEYGDRMTGVLDMVTRSPSVIRTGMGISFTNAWVNTSGVFAGGRGNWIASARRGYLDVILGLVGANEDDENNTPKPRYWDLFGKVSFAPSPSFSMSLAVLAVGDEIVWSEDDEDEFAEVETGYTSRYAWLSGLGALGSSSFVSAAISMGEVTADRGFLVINDPGVEVESHRGALLPHRLAGDPGLGRRAADTRWRSQIGL